MMLYEFFHRAQLSRLEILKLGIKLFIIGETIVPCLCYQRDIEILIYFIVPPILFINLLYAIPQCILRGLLVLPFIYYNFLRTLMNTITSIELQFIMPPISTVYRLWMAAVVLKAILIKDIIKNNKIATSLSRLRPDIQPLFDRKGFILWLGDYATAIKFVLFFLWRRLRPAPRCWPPELVP